MSIINIKINDQAKTVAEHTVVTQNGQPTIIKALDKVNYELFDESTGHAPNRIISKRNVKDLHVSFENGTQNPDLIIEGFYDSVDSALTGIAEDGSYYYYVPDTGEIADYVTELQAGDTVGQALGGNAQTTPWWVSVSQIQGVNVLPWLAGLTGVGALGAVASSGSDNSSNSKPPADTQAPDAPTNIIISINGVKVTGKGEPYTKVEIKNSKDSVIGESIVKDDGTFEVELNTPQTNGEEINVTLIDNAGNVSAPTNITAPDSTAPNAPVITDFDGTIVTGTAEPGSRVTILDENNTIIGSASANTDTGAYEVVLETPLTNGEVINATATDDADNTSVESESATAPDSTAPNAPVVDINTDGSLVTVTGEEGATVSLTTPNGLIEGTITDGSFIAPLDPALTNGETISATLTDAANNTSDAGTARATDSTAPEAPVITDFDGTIVTGTAEPGSMVTILDENNTIIGSASANTDTGAYEVVLETPLTNGEVINATATDDADNTSVESESATAPDSTAPNAPVVDINTDGSLVTVMGEEGATVSLTTPNGLIEGTIENGSFIAPLDPALTNGETISATLTDAANNTSDAGTARATDSTAPEAPTNLVVNDDGSRVSGLGEPDATVEIKDPTGAVIGTGTVAKDGTFDVVLTTPQRDGENLEVSLTDTAGNPSDSSTATAPDTTAPNAPTEPPVITDNVANDGTNAELTEPETIEDGGITNDATPGIIVPAEQAATGTPQLVVDGKVVPSTSVIDSDGNVTLTPTTALTDGQHDLSYNLKDAANNVSTAAPTVTVTVDTTPPEPVSVTISDGDAFITPDEIDNGNADAAPVTFAFTFAVNDIINGKVDVTIGLPEGAAAGGTIIVNGIEQVLTGQDIVAKKVTLSVQVPNHGEALDVIASIRDRAGNESVTSKATAIVYTDTPSAPSNVTIGNGDALITADEISNDNVDVIIELPKDALAGYTVVVNGIEQVLTIQDIVSGNVLIKVPAPVEGEALTVSATIKDPAGNQSLPMTASATRNTALSPAAPESVMIGDGDDFITADEIVDGKVEVTVKLPVNAVAGHVVIVNSIEQILTAKDIEDGQVMIRVPAPDEGVELVASATIKDSNGQVSPAVIANAVRDTIAPDAPTVAIGNGDSDITENEIDADNNVDIIVGLPAYAVVGDTVIVNGIEQALVAADIAAGSTTVKVPAPVLGTALTVTATIKDAASNVSMPTEATATTVDTIAPIAPAVQLDGPNEVLTVQTEANAIVKVYDSKGQLVTEGTADSNGDFRHTFEPALEKGTILDITATDASGNVSDPTQLVAGVAEVIAAADDFVDLVVDAVPTTTENAPQSNTSFDLVTVGLGPILSADVVAGLGDNAIIFDVGQDQVRQVTMHGDAGGVAIGATSDLYVYKLNESTNQWEQQSVSENWVVAGLLGGKGKDTNFDLTQGKWAFLMAPGEGVAVLTGYSIRVTKDTTLDYGNAESVSGSANGNILTDDDAKFGQDELPANSVVTSINGTIISEDGSTLIEGQYGTLTIQADGSYEYIVNTDFRGPYGSEETFTYIVTSPNGNSSSADLTIQLNIVPAEERIDIDATVVVDVEPTPVLDADRTDVPIDKVGSFSLVNLGVLGPVLGADVLGGKGTMKFSVGENQVRELTFKGDGGGVVSVGTQHDLFIYKLDEATGNFVQVHAENNWFTTIIGGSVSKELALQFDEGVYRAILVPKGGINVASGSGLEVVEDKLYDYDTPLTFTGSVTDQDMTEDGNTVLLKVGDQLVEPGQATIVQGQYGELTINSDGTYSYNVEKPADTGADWKPPYGKVDSFKLVTQNANGKSIVEKLNIKISTHTAIDDFSATTINEQNVTSDIRFTRDYKSVGNYGNSMEETFEITENQAASATLDVQTSALNVTYTLTNLTTGDIFTKTETAESKGVSLNISIDELPPGQYTIEINSSGGFAGGNIKGYQFVTNLVHTDEYTASFIAPVTGSLLDNDTGTANIAELKIGNLEVFVADANQGAKSIEIEGQYGTLTVGKDGSYQYVPNGGIYGVETFVYETVSITGVKESATLEINVGKTITASIHNDSAVSSAANDIFMMGVGADTISFDNLGGTLGGNGNNGVDTWTDFSAIQGDKIDITGLLDGNQTAENIGDYLKYENGMLMVDRNGNAEFEALLQVTATDLNELLDSINWEANSISTSSVSVSNLSMDTAASDTDNDIFDINEDVNSAIYTGLGSDTINLAGNISDTALLNMGEGFDTLNLTGAGQLISLSDVFETEVIDISGISANTLTAREEDVARAETSNPIYVKGNSDDTVNLQGDNWVKTAQSVTDNEGQTYDVWQVDSNLASQIYIDSDITNII